MPSLHRSYLADTWEPLIQAVLGSRANISKQKPHQQWDFILCSEWVFVHFVALGICFLHRG